jgi:hypothetical protein
MGVAMLCLVILREVLGFKGIVADDDAPNVVGLALGSAVPLAGVSP